MKKFTIIGLILAIMAMGVFLACAGVSTKTKSGSRQMMITVDTQTGRIVSVVDEEGNKATKVGPEELDKIYYSEDGFRYVGTILYSHSSPGCVIIHIGGTALKICF